MKLNELFYQAPKRVLAEKAPKEEKPRVDPYGEETYGTWTIKYRNIPKANGEYEAIGMHPRNPNTPKVTSRDKGHTIAMVKKDIDRHMANDELALTHSQATIDYNAEFTREVIDVHGKTGVRLVRKGGEVYLILASVEYHDAFGDEIYGTGADMFTKFHLRKAAPGESTKAANLYSSSLTTNQIRSLGLKGNARYAVIDETKDMEYGHIIYKLVYDSPVLSTGDKQKLGAPGLTIAVF